MSDRWARLTELFGRAAELPPGQLDAFLAEHCAGEPALEVELRSLLAHARSAEGFLESSPLDLGGVATIADAPAAPPASPAEQTVGAWRLVRELGEGGMGVVWLAERSDGQFLQRGALKVIRHGLASEEMVRRFRRERRILAALQHPNIAHLLDGGSTPEGLPYLVMEHVEGELLPAACATRFATVRERLALFLAICDAVHYAHQRLVLHRDLKPGNVIVRPDGTPKLLDFGVAKLLDAPGADEEADLRTVALPITVPYASPEVLRGEPATIASDVYALGVLLFELLTGELPFPARANASGDAARAALAADPPRPSAVESATPKSDGATPRSPSRLPPPRESAAARARALRGDLDNIVQQALAVDPARRYGSVEQLATDVRRHLDGHPVSARPDAWSYRAGKFVRRHRVNVLAGAFALLALLGGLVVAIRQAAVARHERALAEQRLAQVQSLANTLLFDVFDGIENMPGATSVRKDVVQKATGFLESLWQQTGRDSSLQLSLADAYERLGRAQFEIWVGNASGLTAAGVSFDRARTLREDVRRRYPRSARALEGLVQVYSRIGGLDQVSQRLEEGLVMMRHAAACGETLVTLFPDHAPYRAALPKRYNNVANALLLLGRSEEALPEIRRAVAGFDSLARADTSDWGSRRLLAMSSMVYAGCVNNRGAGHDSSLALQRRALAIYTDLWHRRLDDLDLELRVSDVHASLAMTYLDERGGADSAVAHARVARRMLEAIAARDPANRGGAQNAVGGLAFEGRVLAMTGRMDEASAALARAAPRIDAWWRADSTDQHLVDARAEIALGSALVDLDRAQRAPPADAAAAWTSARTWFTRAQGSFGSGSGFAEPAAITRGLAACDSALGTPRDAGARATRAGSAATSRHRG